MDARKIALENEIFTALSGSISYGTSTKDSDEDVRSIFVGNPENRLGLNKIEQVKLDGDDSVSYELATIFHHWTTGAVNMLELLFIDPQFYRSGSSHWEQILKNRALFMSKQFGHKAIGFVSGMLKRSQGNREKEDQAEWAAVMRKQATHAVRIGLMASEALLTGELLVYREGEDSDYLRDIKSGKWPAEKAWEHAERLIQVLKTNLELSPLPDAVDMAQINDLLIYVTFRFWKNRNLVPDF